MWTRLSITLFSVVFLFSWEVTALGQGETKLYGVNYSLRIGPDWAWGEDRCKTYERLLGDLTELLAITNNVRVFSLTDCDTGALLLQATQRAGMGLWLGIWVGPNQSNFEEERNRLQDLLSQYDFSNVLGIHVSSEAIYREDITVEEAIALRNTIKQDMVQAGLGHLPITVADIADTYTQYPNLVRVDSRVVTANLFPFWEPTLININGNSPSNQNPNYPSAAEFFYNKFWFVEQLAESRQIIITETGWPDAGTNQYANVAAPASMAKWLRDFVCLANERGWQYFWFDAYDSDWRRVNEQNPNDVEGHFGLFDEEGNLKQHIRDLVIDCNAPYWDVDPNGISNPTMSPSRQKQSTLPPSTAPIETTSMPIALPVTPLPTRVPTDSPFTVPPSQFPSAGVTTATTTNAPTNLLRTGVPTLSPTPDPTLNPTTLSPTIPPTSGATRNPTQNPSVVTPLPTLSPTPDPTQHLTQNPSQHPTQNPTLSPTPDPTQSPTQNPTTSVPTRSPTPDPTQSPTQAASMVTPLQTPSPTPDDATQSPTMTPTTSNLQSGQPTIAIPTSEEEGQPTTTTSPEEGQEGNFPDSLVDGPTSQARHTGGSMGQWALLLFVPWVAICCL